MKTLTTISKFELYELYLSLLIHLKKNNSLIQIMTQLISFNTIQAIVKKRPSKIIKSPYVADIEIDGVEYLAHTPGLHLGGQIVEGSVVFVQTSNPNCSTHYKIISVLINNTFICAQPTLANDIFSQAVKLKLLPEFQEFHSFQREVHIEKGHRIDFKIDENYIEVKSVVCANDDTAIFPVGGKLKQYDGFKTISERAVKHLKCLTNMSLNGKTCYLYFVILRNDCNRFQPAIDKDPYFCEMLSKAYDNNVIIKCFDVNVSQNDISFNKIINYTNDQSGR